MKNILVFIGVIIFVGYVFDWGWLKGEITEYPVSCPGDFHEGNGCFPLNTTTYIPNSSRQDVISKGTIGTVRYKKCAVADRKNWSCRYDDESGEFGFKDGQYYAFSLDRKSSIMQAMLNKTRYVIRPIYLLEWWNLQ